MVNFIKPYSNGKATVRKKMYCTMCHCVEQETKHAYSITLLSVMKYKYIRTAQLMTKNGLALRTRKLLAIHRNSICPFPLCLQLGK
jgi:hypothetical protein